MSSSRYERNKCAVIKLHVWYINITMSLACVVLCKSSTSEQQVARFCLCSLCLNVVALASQWQPLITQAAAQLIAASVPALADKAVSDAISLGGSEHDVNRIAQAADNLDVAIHPQVTAPSSGRDWLFTVEWQADKEDDSKNIEGFWPFYMSMCVMARAKLSVSLHEIYSTVHNILHNFLLRGSSCARP